MIKEYTYLHSKIMFYEKWIFELDYYKWHFNPINIVESYLDVKLQLNKQMIRNS